MTGPAGVDYAWSKPILTGLGQDVKFVVRYLSYDHSGKNLTPGEAAQLCSAGLSIVSNWEYGPDAAKLGFNQGRADAAEACAQHAACGGPADRPIYFSVDFDVPDYAPGSGDPYVKLGPIADYFRGIASVIGLERTGAYGGYWLISRLFAANLIDWGWQTYAWSGGRWEPRAQLRQVENGVQLGGADVDRDQAQGPDFGQWTVTSAPPPAPAPQGDPMLTNWNTIRRGDSGPNVSVAQGLLIAHGYQVGSRDGRPDGSFGPTTEASTRQLQAGHGIAVDGIFGAHTLSVALYGRDLA